MYQFGVDEAGKGPVFGSMFAATVCVENTGRLPDGIADSKRLSVRRREELAATLRETDGIHVGVAEISTARIDDPDTNMNGLAVAAHANAIEDAFGELGSDELKDTDRDNSGDATVSGLCDACDTDADRFARRVGEACSLEATIDARHGADDDSDLVGAASIIAKVERDAHVADLAAEFGEIGSGYPGDSTTRAFLESYVEETGELPPFARKSWSTCTDVLAEASQTSLDGF
ncbi:ribonuclease HII [Halostagnicola sp. A-GB9-2]|uniref:ribonuclease HII n=1 Tax=Halostagnicola sp. A-GB9-2 TaxID=3048066 RepID=UPI0024C02A93|nr:ribonuclease HII [Halostagnicola sp. A-GB9-2]MDJ1430815.1 ribonuclease HII [Halostagnicola sp. A-GB9-2]